MRPQSPNRTAHQWLQLPARDLSAAAVDGIQRVLARNQGADVLVLAEQSSAAQTVRALEQLAAACGNGASKQPAAPRVVVRTRAADVKTLRLLAKAGAQTVEWQVAAPLIALLDQADVGGLRAALVSAHAAGVNVRLRWAVSRHDAASLALAADAGAALDALRAAQLAPAEVTLLVAPDTRASTAPRLDVVAQHWPRREGAQSERTVVQGLRLHRSVRWPVCLPGDADALEAASAAERDGDVFGWQAPCDGCPSRGPCPGFAAELWRTLQREGGHWAGLQQRAAQPSLQAVQAAGHVGFSVDAVELRGLRMGLRQAWRLSLPPQSIAAWQEALDGLGLQLVASAEPVHFGAGGRMTAGKGAEHLVVVSANPELAKQCLAHELEALALVLPVQRNAQIEALAQQHLKRMLDIHRFVGSAYGYPACCIEAFCDAFLEVVRVARSGDNALALLRAAWRTKVFWPELDVLSVRPGAAGRSPLRHLPCRFDCPASLGLAQRLLADRGGTARTPKPRAVLVLADGSLIGLDTTQPGSVSRNHVGSVDAATSAAHDLQQQAALGALADQWRGVELRVTTASAGQRVVQTRRGRGRWQTQQLPAVSGPLAEHFPLMLPFGASGQA